MKSRLMAKYTGAAFAVTIPRSTRPCIRTNTVPTKVMTSKTIALSWANLSANAVTKGTATMDKLEMPSATPTAASSRKRSRRNNEVNRDMPLARTVKTAKNPALGA